MIILDWYFIKIYTKFLNRYIIIDTILFNLLLQRLIKIYLQKIWTTNTSRKLEYYTQL